VTITPLHGCSQDSIRSEAAPTNTPLRTAPSNGDDADFIGDLSLIPGDRYPLLMIDAGEEDALGTIAEAYCVWYCIALPTGAEGWVRAVVPSTNDAGSDGRPSSVRFDFRPGVAAPE
jgi:hypothetical protein